MVISAYHDAVVWNYLFVIFNSMQVISGEVIFTLLIPIVKFLKLQLYDFRDF